MYIFQKNDFEKFNSFLIFINVKFFEIILQIR